MKVYTKEKKHLGLMETDSILIKGKRGRFPKRQTGCLKGSDGVKLIRRKYISISEVISLSYSRPVI